MASSHITQGSLFVEGANDKHVIAALCGQQDIPQTFVITDCGGLPKVLNNFRVALQSSVQATPAIGLVLDADESLAPRWQSVRDIIIRANRGYDVPKMLNLGGTIIPAPNAYRPSLGVWFMPNNEIKGDLEDFVRFLIPSTDMLTPYANGVLDTIEQAGLNQYEKRSKAFLHTWLAWQKRPLPMGQAITEKALTADHPLSQQFVTWLNRLFNP